VKGVKGVEEGREEGRGREEERGRKEGRGRKDGRKAERTETREAVE
jgi:hypothetical protein